MIDSGEKWTFLLIYRIDVKLRELSLKISRFVYLRILNNWFLFFLFLFRLFSLGNTLEIYLYSEFIFTVKYGGTWLYEFYDIHFPYFSDSNSDCVPLVQIYFSVFLEVYTLKFLFQFQAVGALWVQFCRDVWRYYGHCITYQIFLDNNLTIT